VGVAIDRESFTEEDDRRFRARLERDLDALAELLVRPGFGEGPRSIGAELELDLVDERARPRAVNMQVLASANDPRIALEINAFNIELNARPNALAGRAFRTLARELDDGLAILGRAAAAHGARLVPIGILPTLGRGDLGAAALTPQPRYRAMSRALRRLHDGPFPVRIQGDDRVSLVTDDVSWEGANTSFQVHLRVAPRDYAAAYDAAQIATGPALAIATNSPYFLGRDLWDETRIALFRQCCDDRQGAVDDDWRPARVSFGHGYVRRDPHALFAETVALHDPILPVLGDEPDPVEIVRAGGVPKLGALRLHHGTVWRWNRAVFDDADGGHLRVELRALPSGPSVVDMTANAAFLLGLTLAVAEQIDRFTPAFPFGHAVRNFYEAAKHGPSAELLWPRRPGARAIARPASELATELVDLAGEGLVEAGVDHEDAVRYLAIITDRARAGVTGATWQRAVHRAFAARVRSDEAFRLMTLRYAEESASGRPVHEWSTRV
jgi:gamma-glutamylcysteine synthetase